ncbi:MAG: hypothetical protein A2017_21385 [Lentisphaerae bacterium GWF2_44_16]|nr:MAG: hypothetical protein A2017_21385 [Lentisphaerae bacterium GWF2_44_16]
MKRSTEIIKETAGMLLYNGQMEQAGGTHQTNGKEERLSSHGARSEKSWTKLKVCINGSPRRSRFGPEFDPGIFDYYF